MLFKALLLHLPLMLVHSVHLQHAAGLEGVAEVGGGCRRVDQRSHVLVSQDGRAAGAARFLARLGVSRLDDQVELGGR